MFSQPLRKFMVTRNIPRILEVILIGFNNHLLMALSITRTRLSSFQISYYNTPSSFVSYSPSILTKACRVWELFWVHLCDSFQKSAKASHNSYRNNGFTIQLNWICYIDHSLSIKLKSLEVD